MRETPVREIRRDVALDQAGVEVFERPGMVTALVQERHQGGRDDGLSRHIRERFHRTPMKYRKRLALSAHCWRWTRWPRARAARPPRCGSLVATKRLFRRDRAAERPQRYDSRRAGQSRHQAKPVDECKSDRRDKQDDFGRKQLPVRRLDERAKAADQHYAVDRAGQRQKCHGGVADLREMRQRRVGERHIGRPVRAHRPRRSNRPSGSSPPSQVRRQRSDAPSWLISWLSPPPISIAAWPGPAEAGGAPAAPPGSSHAWSSSRPATHQAERQQRLRQTWPRSPAPDLPELGRRQHPGLPAPFGIERGGGRSRYLAATNGTIAACGRERDQ